MAGFGLLEAGSVDDKLAVNVIFKNMIDSSLAAIMFWMLGYAFAFGSSSSNGFIGYGEFFLIGMNENLWAFFFFQYSFCGTTTTILSGAAAGRLRIQGYMIYCMVCATFIHPIAAHWLWSTSGWLSVTSNSALFGVGVYDFAGGLVVHTSGGIAGLACVIVAGYRNQYSSDPAHPPVFEKTADGKWRKNAWKTSPTVTATGAFILWFAFFAFNMGSQITFVGKGRVVALVCINTALCTAFATLSSIYFSQMRQYLRGVRPSRWMLGDVVNGALAGLVSSTSGCSVVRPWAMVIIGIVGGVVVQLGMDLVDRFRIDDPVQAIPVHAGCGVWAPIAAALFADSHLVAASYGVQNSLRYGLLMGGGWEHFVAALIAVVCVLCWSFMCSMILFVVLYFVDKKFGKFQWFFLRDFYHGEEIALIQPSKRDNKIVRLGIADFTAVSLGDEPNKIYVEGITLEDEPESRDARFKESNDPTSEDSKTSSNSGSGGGFLRKVTARKKKRSTGIEMLEKPSRQDSLMRARNSKQVKDVLEVESAAMIARERHRSKEMEEAPLQQQQQQRDLEEKANEATKSMKEESVDDSDKSHDYEASFEQSKVVL